MNTPGFPRSARRLATFATALAVLGALTATFFYTRARAATTYTWNQTGTASWATSTNWTPTRTTPATDDVLVFNNGATTTVTNVPAETIGQLSVTGNTTVNLQAAAVVTLAIAGGAGTDLSVDSGSALNCNTTNAITVALGAGATGSVSGAMTLSSSASTAHRLTAADAGGITFQNGSTFTAGTNFNGNAFGTTSLNSVVFASGSTFVFIAGGNPFGAGQPNSVVVFQSGSLYKQQGTGTPSFSGRTYANFELNVAGTVSVNGGNAVSLDNLTITQGTLNFGMTATPGHAIKGNISVASGATLNFNPASAGTVNFSGASAQTISNSGTFSTNANQTFVVANTNGVTVNNALTFNGPTTVNSGATLATSATLTTNGAVAVNGNLQINQNGFYAGTGTYTYDPVNATLVFNNSSGSFVVSGTPVFWPTTNGPQNVNVKGAGGITLNVARTVGLLFQYAAGVSGAGNLTLNGTSQVNNGGFTSGSPTYGSSSLLKYNLNTSYGRNGEWLPNATSGAGYPVNVQLSNNTNLDLPNGSSNAFFQMSGNLTIDSGSTMNLNGSPAMTLPLISLGNVTNNGTLTLSNALGGDLKLQGSFTNNATFTPNNRAVFFEGANMQSITALSGALSIPYVVISKSGGTVSLNNTDLTTLAPNAGASINFVGGNSTLTLNGRTLTLGSSIGNTPAGSGFIGDTSAGMSLQDGGSAGSMGTLTFVSGSQSLQNLTVNRAGGVGTVILGSNLTVGGTLALTAGQVITNTNTLTTAGTVTRTTGYVNGNLKKPYSVISTKNFEVGTANGYSPVLLDVSSGTFPTEITVKAVQGQLPQITGTNALQRYWTISATTPVLISMTVNYLAADVVGNTASYAFIRNNGGTLEQIAPNGQAGATSAGVGNVSPFTTTDWTLAEPSAVFGTFQFSAANYDDTETDSGTHNVTVTVQRTGGSSGAVSVHYATSDGTATIADNDYVSTSGDLNWGDGETTDKTFDVTVNGDTSFEPDETVNLLLSAPTGGSALGSQFAATVTIQNDDIVTALSGTKTVCASGCDYLNLTGASGLFAAVNAAGLSGDLTAEIAGALTKDGANALNQWTETGAGGYTLSIVPADGTTKLISGNVAAGMIRLDGADRVNIDGRFSAAGRFLTFRNTNPSGATITLINDASNNTIRSSVVEGAANTAMRGVILFSTGTTNGNDNNTVTDNQVRDRSDAPGVPFNLILSSGTAGAAANSNNTVSNNELFNFFNRGVNVSGVVANSSESWTITGNNVYQTAARPGSTLLGISVGAAGSNTITGNTIHDLTAGGPIIRGINLSLTGSGTTNVSGNRIYSLSNSSNGTETTGIGAFVNDTATVNVFNNMVSVVPSGTNNQGVYGLYDQGVAGTTVNFFYNSILVGGTASGTIPSWACVRNDGASSAATWRNNICFNDRTGGGANHFAAGNQSALGTFSSDYNIFVGTGATASDFMDYGTSDAGTPVSFATWQTSTGGDANSLAANPGGDYTVANMFTSATDLHLNLTGTNPASNVATPLAGVTNDFDNDTRDTVIPDLGADEVASDTSLQFSSATYSVSEGAGFVTITATRTGSSVGAFGAQYATSDGTATAGDDYTALSDGLVWADGDMSPKSFNVPIGDDALYEGNETFDITLVALSGATTGTPSMATVTINDNDTAPTLTTVNIGQDETNSGISNVVYIVTKTGATELTATVQFQTADGTTTSGAACAPGVDYVSNSGTLTFLPGETTQSITLEVCGDTDFEPDETYTLTLSNPTNATLPPGTGVYNGEISNDDAPSASLVVTKTADTNDGLCDSDCSLREAVSAANLNADPNTIIFQIPNDDPDYNVGTGVYTIKLTHPLGGLSVDYDLTINGPGANVLTISGNQANRIFSTQTGVALTLDGMTIRDAAAGPAGGAISNSGTMTISNCILTDNSAGGGGPTAEGGAINNSGTLTIINSMLSNNSATGSVGRGGAISNSGMLTIINSTLSGNTTHSTSTGNGSASHGGAIFNSGSNAVVNLINSTLSGNSAVGGSSTPFGGAQAFGGAIYNAAGGQGVVRLTNCTLSGNFVSAGDQTAGGGIYNNGGVVSGRNTIIAQGISTDVFGAFESQGHNVIGNTNGAVITNSDPYPGGDKFDAAASPLNLGALQNNGGTTETRALGAGSVAIDAGDDCVADAAHCGDANIPQLAFDQRGTGFPRKVDGDGDSTATVDIGAYEVQTPFPSFSIDDVTQSEGNSGTTDFVFTVTKTGAGAAGVDFTTVDGTATTADNDYQPNSGTLNFASGDGTQTIIVKVNGDTNVESNEAFTVNLSNASDATIPDADGTGTIQNDDVPLPSLSIDDVTQTEGNAGTTAFTFTVTKTGADAASVDFDTQDGTAEDASDYASNSGTLTFASGDATMQITVLVNGDTTPEVDEVFTVQLSNPSNATITDGEGLGTITNDDESVSAGQLIISEFRLRGPGTGVTSAPESAPQSASKQAPKQTAAAARCTGGAATAGTRKLAGAGKLRPRTPVMTAAPLAPPVDTTPESNDEFIELYNNTDTSLFVTTTDGSAGWAVAASDGIVRFIIPNGTVIPARAHFLSPNLLGFSLTDYPSGDGSSQPPLALGDFVIRGDGTTCYGYELDIPDNAGIALFRTAEPTAFSTTTRLDAVGSTAETTTLYKEGAGYTALAAADLAANLEHSFYRSLCSYVPGAGCTTPGLPRDTGDNASDFLFVDTEGTPTAAGQRLGAPSPENLFSPIQSNAQFSSTLLDVTKPAAQAPNRVRDFTSNPGNNSDFGTLSIRRRVTNNTGADVTALRFRIVELTTFPAPPGTADLRALTSADTTAGGILNPEMCAAEGQLPPCVVTVRGTTLEQPPTQPNGGGYNSTLSAGTITLSTPLANGASINVQFVLGIRQTGSFRLLVNIEAVNAASPSAAPARSR